MPSHTRYELGYRESAPCLASGRFAQHARIHEGRDQTEPGAGRDTDPARQTTGGNHGFPEGDDGRRRQMRPRCSA